MEKAKNPSSKARKVKLTTTALHHIEEITNYIAFIKLQPGNAVHVGDQIFETIERISRNPFSFRQCEEIPTKSKTYRKAVCLSWWVIYKITPYEILILGIVHNSRRPTGIKKLKRIK